MVTKISGVCLALLISCTIAEEKEESSFTISDPNPFFRLEWGTEESSSNDVIETPQNEEKRETKRHRLKREKTSDSKWGVSFLGGFSVGSAGLADLNANYSVHYALTDRWELYAVGGHSLGFDSYRKIRLGGSYYLGNPEAFHIGLGLEAGPAFMKRSAGDAAEAFAWTAGRLTADYQFGNGLFAGAYATAGFIPDMINEAGLRIGFNF